MTSRRLVLSFGSFAASMVLLFLMIVYGSSASDASTAWFVAVLLGLAWMLISGVLLIRSIWRFNR